MNVQTQNSIDVENPEPETSEISSENDQITTENDTLVSLSQNQAYSEQIVRTSPKIMRILILFGSFILNLFFIGTSDPRQKFQIPPEMKIQQNDSDLRSYKKMLKQCLLWIFSCCKWMFWSFRKGNGCVLIAIFILREIYFEYLRIEKNCHLEFAEQCPIKFIYPRLRYWLIQMLKFGLGFLFITACYCFNRLRGIYLLISITCLVYLSFFADTARDMKHFGYYFGLLLFSVTVVCHLGFFIFYLIWYCLKKSPKITLVILIIILLPPIFVYKFKFASNTCYSWDKGLSNERLENPTNSCTITTPSYCGFQITHNLFQTFLEYPSCESRRSEIADEDNYDEFYSRGKLLGYPRIEHFPKEHWYIHEVERYLLGGMIPLDSIDDEAARDIEVFKEIKSKGDAKTIIKVKRNETLVQQRAKIKSDSPVKNEESQMTDHCN